MKKYVLVAIVVLAALTRIIPHPWNFTGVGALAVFAGAHLKERWQAIALTWLSMFVGDLYFGLHSTLFYTYGSLALIVFLGHRLSSLETLNSAESSSKTLRALLRKILPWISMSLAGSFLFYIITNFGVWMTSEMYEKSFAGLSQCYLMGLPFLDRQILGDLVYLGVMLGLAHFSKMGARSRVLVN